VDDLGPPGSYLTLEPGVPVFATDGTALGRVEHVLAVPEDDIFDGLVIDTSVLPGGHRFVDASEVAEIHERGVLLAIDRAAAEKLPEPTRNPAVVEADPDDAAESELARKLRRAWDLISGNY
jgi:uncharacterized protein YrrD